MSHKIKFHLIAIVLIVVIVSVLHTVMKPAAAPPPKIVTVVQYSPTIVGATWGRNCNTRIQQALLQVPAVPRPVVPDPSAPKPLQVVEHNNVLETIKTLCANTQTCVFQADSKTLGALLSTCQNQLEVRYYCTETERVRSLNIQQDREVKLDCSNVRR